MIEVTPYKNVQTFDRWHNHFTCIQLADVEDIPTQEVEYQSPGLARMAYMLLSMRFVDTAIRFHLPFADILGERNDAELKRVLVENFSQTVAPFDILTRLLPQSFHSEQTAPRNKEIQSLLRFFSIETMEIIQAIQSNPGFFGGVSYRNANRKLGSVSSQNLVARVNLNNITDSLFPALKRLTYPLWYVETFRITNSLDTQKEFGTPLKVILVQCASLRDWGPIHHLTFSPASNSLYDYRSEEIDIVPEKFIRDFAVSAFESRNPDNVPRLAPF